MSGCDESTGCGLACMETLHGLQGGVVGLKVRIERGVVKVICFGMTGLREES